MEDSRVVWDDEDTST